MNMEKNSILLNLIVEILFLTVTTDLFRKIIAQSELKA